MRSSSASSLWINFKFADEVSPFSPNMALCLIEAISVLRPGENRIEIKVTNRWGNRLIGDAQPGAVKVGWRLHPSIRQRRRFFPQDWLGR